jgi:hypothetical protein
MTDTQNTEPALLEAKYCSGSRQPPKARATVDRVILDNLPPGRRATYLRRYGRTQCSVCQRWYAAHKDGSPVLHPAARDQMP